MIRNRFKLVLLALTLSFGYSAPSSAGGITIHFGSGHHYEQRRDHAHSHRKHHHPRRHHRQHRQHGHFRGHGHRFHRRRFGPRHFGRAARRPCEQVVRTIVDRAGYSRRVGGTMCFDDYGRGYIVPGSRYVISP